MCRFIYATNEIGSITLHSTDVETEAQRDQLTSPRSHLSLCLQSDALQVTLLTAARLTVLKFKL